MDVEGHEVKIFQNGLDYFSINNLVEIHPQFYNNDNALIKFVCYKA